MSKINKTVQGLFKAKQKRRHDLAALPVEEKFKMLVQLQRMAVSIFSQRGIKRKAWPHGQ